MKMSGFKCSYSIIKKRAKSKPQRLAFKVLKGTTLSYSKVLRSLLRICFSNVDNGVISLDNRYGSRNGLSELSSSLKDPLERFVKCSTVSAMKSSDMRKEGSIDEFKATFSASNGLTDPRPLVEWRIVETSMEDGLLARAAVNRNEYTGYRFGGAKTYGETKSYTELNEESRNCRDLGVKERPDLANDSSESRHQDTAVQLGSLKENDLYDAEKNQANTQKNFDDNDDYLLEDRDWNTSKEDIRKRRSLGGGFPPPLACLSGNRCSILPHEAACLQLQRIRGNGRFVLQEVKTPPQVAFKPIRLHGRLILQLINQNNENSTRKLSRDKVAPPQDQIISGAEIKAEKSYPKLLSKLEEATILLKQNVPVISSSLVSHNHLDQKHTHSINASNKQEARESTLHENTRLIPRKKMDNKETSEVSYALDAGLVRRNSFADSQRTNTDAVAADLVHSSRESHLKHDIIYYIIYCADFLDNHLPRKVSGHLSTGAKLYENSVVLNDPTQSLVRFLLFNLRDVMNGVDPAVNLRCKGFERREEDYIAACESRCVASS